MRKVMEHGKTIIEYSVDELAGLPSLTDWERVQALTDKDISAAALSDPDTPSGHSEEDNISLGRGRDALLKIMPEMAANTLLKQRGRPKALKPKELVSVRFSAEVLEFFRAQGKGWQSRMDATLKEYVNQHTL